MFKSRKIALLILVLVTSVWLSWEFRIQANFIRTFGIGPDVIVGDIPDIRRWGSSGGESSFSIATTSCNIGDARLDWIANSNVHPVISQNLYRVHDGRIEQIGMSWLKHGFAVAAGSLCATCTDPSSVYLGVGCSDPYSAGLNGSQGGLGPRSEVNAATGIFAWPHTDLPQNGILDGRIRVPNSELDPAQNPGAVYFVESQYIHPQDASNGNDDNNASYRQAFVSSVGGGNFDINISSGSPTVQEQPAIAAWQAVHSDVQLWNIDIPGDGRVVVGMRRTPQKNGYHTEFAIENLNSHRSVRSLGVRFCSESITNPGFNDVDYQFEPYSGTDWASSINGSEIEWSTDTFASNQNANALRWNTLYSFWCDSAGPPMEMTLGIFRPGGVDEVTIDLTSESLPESILPTVGNLASGGIAELAASDDQYVVMDPQFLASRYQLTYIVNATSPTATPSCLIFDCESRVVNFVGTVDQEIELFNYSTGQYETVDSGVATTTDSLVTVSFSGDPARFVEPGTGAMRARITCQNSLPYWVFRTVNLFLPFRANVDHIVWTITP